MPSKNVESVHDKLFFAVVAPFQGHGEEKLILHEALLGKDGSFGYGMKSTLVVDPSAVLRIEPESPLPGVQ